MKTLKHTSAVITGLLFSILCSEVYSLHFWEIPDPKAPFIAMARNGPGDFATVVYNSVYCEQIGAACIFFRTHEQAHVFLNDLFLPPERQPATVEDNADCWAAKFITPQEAYAAVKFLKEVDKYPDIPVTGDPAHRAEVVEKCAKEGDNWIAHD